MVRRSVLGLALLVIVSGCGGSSTPSAPSGSSTPGSGSGSRGTITAVIDGVTFTGTASEASRNAAGIFATAASSGNTTLGFAALAAVGTTTIGGLSPTNAQLGITSGSTLNLWVGNVTGGSGTLTITSMTSTGASGTFSFTLTASPGSGATGVKNVTNGVFNVTF